MSKQNTLYSEIFRRLSLEDFSRMRLLSAEPKSLYSDHSMDEDFTWGLHVPKTLKRNPRQLIALLVIISREEPFWYTEFLEICGQQCRKYNYDGPWMLLHKLVKLYHHDMIVYRLSERVSGNDFFGNYYKYIINYLRNPFIVYRRTAKPKPKSMQRIRGYRDKGSRIESHKKIVQQVVTGENPERRDYSGQYKRKNVFLNFLYG